MTEAFTPGPWFVGHEDDFDRRNIIEEQKRAISERMDKLVAALQTLDKLKKKMVARQLPAAKATCPWCGKKGALLLNVAIDVNNHMRAHCTSCGEGFIE